MTKLVKDPITGSFQLPSTPGVTTSPGTIYLGSAPSSSVGIGAFNLPSTLTPVATASSQKTSYTPSALQTKPIVAQNNPATISFTTALIQMLKEAQGRDQTGQAGLMKQSQGITGQGINDAVRNFNNPLLAPSSGTSLGMSAQNQFDPLQLSIGNQQKLATQNLNNITDVIKETQTAYDKEQDRIAKEKEKAAKPTNTVFDTQGNIAATEAKMRKIAGSDGYIDPAVWVQMKSAWKAHGGSAAAFISNFKDYVNPKSYSAVGLKSTDEVSPDMQALLDSLQG